MRMADLTWIAVALLPTLTPASSHAAAFDPQTYVLPGTADESYTPVTLADPDGRPMHSHAAIVQPDGALLAFGKVNLTTLPDPPDIRDVCRRWRADGTEDASFHSPVFAGDSCEWYQNRIGLQPDGKILLAACFATVDGTPRPGFARLHPDGALDKTFVPAVNRANSFVVQPDGRILVHDALTLHRLLPNGRRDVSFRVWELHDDYIWMVLQSDGRVIVHRGVDEDDGRAFDILARLNADGSLDEDFVVPPEVQAGLWRAWPETSRLAIDRDGRILLSGHFKNPVVPGAWVGIVRLNPDGSVDRTFVTGKFPGPGPFPGTFLEEADGSWLFWSCSADNPVGCELTRILPDGSNDPFLRLANRVIGAHDGKLLVSDRSMQVITRISAGRISFSFRDLEVTPARRVKLSLNAPTSNGRFPTPDFLLETSTDLQTWLPLRTNTASGLKLQFEDTEAPSHPWRFYRARVQMP